MKLGVKPDVMQMKIALTCGIDRKTKNASCIDLAIKWLIMPCMQENCLRRNKIEIP